MAVCCVFKNKIEKCPDLMEHIWDRAMLSEASTFWIKKYDYHLPALISASGLIRCVQRIIFHSFTDTKTERVFNEMQELK